MLVSIVTVTVVALPQMYIHRENSGTAEYWHNVICSLFHCLRVPIKSINHHGANDQKRKLYRSSRKSRKVCHCLSFSSLSWKNAAFRSQYGPQYEWKAQKGLLLGAFFWGSFVGTIPAGLLSEYYGGKTLTTVGLLISGIFTALTPVMCDISVWAFFINRFCIGLAGVSMNGGRWMVFTLLNVLWWPL